VTPRPAAAALLVWALGFLFTLANYAFTDDHFDRTSRARQIARYGELPFRDFFDPGYFLTEMLSAAVQRLAGDNLLGEVLFTSALIAAGVMLVSTLVRRVAPSSTSVVIVTALAIVAAPRPYDFDKALFYPLGIWLCWRYVDRQTVRNLLWLAAGAVVAGMFRYDNGLFIAAGGLAAIAAVHSGEPATLMRRAGVFLAGCVVCAVPYLTALQLTGGVGDAADQMVDYARREAARTRLAELPTDVFSDLRLERLPAPPPDRIQVRWTPESDSQRPLLEERFRLHDGVLRGEQADRTWLYEIDDSSRENLRALIDDPRVADTHLVDRATAQLVSQEPPATRFRRRVPLLGAWNIAWSTSGAAALLYYVFLGVPIIAAVVVFARSVDRAQRARVLSATAVALPVAIFILRDPIVARIGGAFGPTAIVGTWMWSRVHRSWLARAAAAAIAVTVVVASGFNIDPSRLSRVIKQAAMSPPDPALLLEREEAALVDYLRRCTDPDDRVFAAWFAPHLYFFSGRGFAGGMVVTFGGHWSEPDRQHRIVAKLRTEEVPVVIFQNDRSDFRAAYPMVDEYLRINYANDSSWGSEVGYQVLARNERPPRC
jgi:hypothetical protein